MSEGWKSYNGAPAEGRDLCALDDISDGDTLCLDLDGFPLVLVRRGEDVKAYVNACPHQYLPLNHKGEKLISADRTILRCTNHAAGFSVATGEGVEGLGVGTCLDVVPISLSGGRLKVGSSPGRLAAIKQAMPR